MVCVWTELIDGMRVKGGMKGMGAMKMPGLSGPALPTGALSPAQQKNEEKKAIGLPKF